jgi:hypothetical protein
MQGPGFYKPGEGGKLIESGETKCGKIPVSKRWIEG